MGLARINLCVILNEMIKKRINKNIREKIIMAILKKTVYEKQLIRS